MLENLNTPENLIVRIGYFCAALQKYWLDLEPVVNIGRIKIYGTSDTKRKMPEARSNANHLTIHRLKIRYKK